MNIVELKKDLHKIIDETDNDKLLEGFYNLMKVKISSKEGELWSSLTEKEQSELLEAFEESKDPDNLIEHKDVMRKYSKWL